MGRYRIPDGVNHRVLDHYPGETFEADLDPAQEARLIARGQLEPTTSLDALSREQLDHLAAQQGVENPSALPNKDAVIAAINDQKKGA